MWGGLKTLTSTIPCPGTSHFNPLKNYLGFKRWLSVIPTFKGSSECWKEQTNRGDQCGLEKSSRELPYPIYYLTWPWPCHKKTALGKALKKVAKCRKAEFPYVIWKQSETIHPEEPLSTVQRNWEWDEDGQFWELWSWDVESCIKANGNASSRQKEMQLELPLVFFSQLSALFLITSPLLIHLNISVWKSISSDYLGEGEREREEARSERMGGLIYTSLLLSIHKDYGSVHTWEPAWSATGPLCVLK